ncbi:MAG: hypothetical protein GY822_16985 [Deltaproteobacteria bacterium]|nr:hypothetical protein [Deltaproteobacteria bacterium]
MRSISAALEETLGTKVFDRRSAGYLLTSAGEELLLAAERVEAETQGIERRISGRDAALSGSLRVTLPNSLAFNLLMPAFAEFSKQHPGIDLELVVSFQLLELDKREADVAIRFSNTHSQHLVGRRLFKMARAVYASPAYLESCGWPDDTSRFTWIGWRGRSDLDRLDDPPLSSGADSTPHQQFSRPTRSRKSEYGHDTSALFLGRP